MHAAVPVQPGRSGLVFKTFNERANEAIKIDFLGPGPANPLDSLILLSNAS